MDFCLPVPSLAELSTGAWGSYICIAHLCGGQQVSGQSAHLCSGQ